MPFYAVTFLRIFVVAWVGVALAQIIYGRSDVERSIGWSSSIPVGSKAWFGAQVRTGIGMLAINGGMGFQ